MTDVKYNVVKALENYRELKAYVKHAIGAMDWYMGEYTISSQVRSIINSRADTMTIMSHIDRALAIFKAECEAKGSIRLYNMVQRKYIDPGHLTYAKLADLFDCSPKTAKRDIRMSLMKIKAHFFGISGFSGQ